MENMYIEEGNKPTLPPIPPAHPLHAHPFTPQSERELICTPYPPLSKTNTHKKPWSKAFNNILMLLLQYYNFEKKSLVNIPVSTTITNSSRIKCKD
jgi:hypothetical protein